MRVLVDRAVRGQPPRDVQACVAIALYLPPVPMV